MWRLWDDSHCDLQPSGHGLLHTSCESYTASTRCPACKHFAPIYEAAAQEIEASVHSRDILVSRADCATETVLCNRFSVKGYPTVLFGRPSQFLKVRRSHSTLLLTCRISFELNLISAARPVFVCGLAGCQPEASQLRWRSQYPTGSGSLGCRRYQHVSLCCSMQTFSTAHAASRQRMNTSGWVDRTIEPRETLADQPGALGPKANTSMRTVAQQHAAGQVHLDHLPPGFHAFGSVRSSLCNLSIWRPC
jgi:thiol-disulfide isomerase/thioredoxin